MYLNVLSDQSAHFSTLVAPALSCHFNYPFYAMSCQYSGYTASKSATCSSAELNQCNNSEYLPNLFVHLLNLQKN
jgi:hypothetical protein